MNTILLDRKATDPLLNLRNCQGLSVMYSPMPEANLRATQTETLTSDDNVGWRALDTVAPPAAWCSGNGAMIVWVAGTSGNIHLQQLLNGWNNVYDDWQTSYGASGAFYNAARAILETIGPQELALCNRFYLIGHSYGGATVQAMAAILRGSGNPQIKVWSYGAPRPGLFRLGTLLQGVSNTRFFTDDDPVRFIPPHSSEVPSLTALEPWSFINQLNTQVQAPNGVELQADGKMVETEGNPTPLTAVAYSVAAWVTDISGFRSVNHALANYITRFTLAYNTANPIVLEGPARPREEPEVLTMRERQAVIREGVQDVENALAVLPNQNTAYVVPQLPPNSPIRYVRRRVGKVWGVKYAGQVVAIGPGKRQARKLARQYNRQAQVSW